MIRPKIILKLGAVASSAVLVAGFVSYRAGAFDRTGGSEWPSVEPAPDQNAPDATAQQPADGVTSGAVLSGSKSGIFVVPPGPTVGGPTTGGGSTIVLPGSKSIAPVIPPAPSPPAQSAGPAK